MGTSADNTALKRGVNENLPGNSRAGRGPDHRRTIGNLKRLLQIAVCSTPAHSHEIAPAVTDHGRVTALPAALDEAGVLADASELGKVCDSEDAIANTRDARAPRQSLITDHLTTIPVL